MKRYVDRTIGTFVLNNGGSCLKYTSILVGFSAVCKDEIDLLLATVGLAGYFFGNLCTSIAKELSLSDKFSELEKRIETFNKDKTTNKNQ